LFQVVDAIRTNNYTKGNFDLTLPE